MARPRAMVWAPAEPDRLVLRQAAAGAACVRRIRASVPIAPLRSLTTSLKDLAIAAATGFRLCELTPPRFSDRPSQTNTWRKRRAPASSCKLAAFDRAIFHAIAVDA
jgi:hypothetical protein